MHGHKKVNCEFNKTKKIYSRENRECKYSDEQFNTEEEMTKALKNDTDMVIDADMKLL